MNVWTIFCANPPSGSQTISSSKHLKQVSAGRERVNQSCVLQGNPTKTQGQDERVLQASDSVWLLVWYFDEHWNNVFSDRSTVIWHGHVIILHRGSRLHDVAPVSNYTRTTAESESTSVICLSLSLSVCILSFCLSVTVWMSANWD